VSGEFPHVRHNEGLPPLDRGTAYPLPHLDARAGGLPLERSEHELLTAILDEKYIGLFQNYEVYNDWKRTCYPNLQPSTQAFQGNIPARFTYPVAERSSNPDNIPSAGAQPRRNSNDPVNATSADGTACIAQKP